MNQMHSESTACDAEEAAAWYARQPWTRHHPYRVPPDFDRASEGTVLALLLSACDRYADRIAFELDGEYLTFGEWRRQADCLARFFAHEWKLDAGERVMIFLPNLPAYPIALLAAWMAGLIVLPVYCANTAAEIEGPLAGVTPAAIVGLDVLMDTFRAARGADAVRELVVTAPAALFGVAAPLPAHAVGFAAAIAKGATLPQVNRSVQSGDVALMSYTGGTTGVSKAVRITQGNMCAGIEMLRLAMAEHTNPGADLIASVHPFSHAAGMSVNLLQFSSIGATQLLFPLMTRTDLLVEGWRDRPVTAMLAGPAFYLHLLATPGFSGLDFSALRAGLVGGMPLRPDIRNGWEAVTGKPMIEGYGLTESSTPIAAQLAADRRAGSVGFPFASVQLTIRDPDEPGLPAVPPGTSGEVWLRGPWLMSGYHERADETARVMTADGWFRTGDIGRMDSDGSLYLLGRIKDMILVDGANVYPAAIEDVVGAHPGVADVCAVGMADDECGERVRLFLVRRDPALDAASVARWCEERMAHFKQPKRIEFLDALPRSAVDKVLRRELQQRPLS